MNNHSLRRKTLRIKRNKPSMVAMEDSFSEIAKVMQDCESETQEPMEVEEEKDDMPKLKRGQKYSGEGFVESARCG